MTLTNQKKLAKHIMRLLKVTDITLPIGRTSKGNLGITFNANNEDFEIMLDSVPLSTKDSLNDENNIELKKMIEKYMFEQENIIHMTTRPELGGPSLESIAAGTPFERVSPAKSEPKKKGKK